MSSKIPVSVESSTSPKRLQVDNNEPEIFSDFADSMLVEALIDYFGFTSTQTDLTNDDLAIILFYAIESRIAPIPRSDWHMRDIHDPEERTRLFELAKVATGGERILENAIRNAWATKKFSDIRTAVFLKESIPQRPHTLQDESASIHVDHHLRDVVHKAWKIPYQTDCHRYLHETIQNIKLEGMNMGLFRPSHSPNSMSIVQSSGSGKSRLVNELASLIFTIPFNLCDQHKTRFLAHCPDPDPDVRNYFTVNGEKKELMSRFEAFFECLFEALNEWLQEQLDQNQHVGAQELAESWKGYLGTQENRNSFYRKVVQNAEKKTKSNTLKSDIERLRGLGSPPSLKDFIARLPTDPSEYHPVKVIIYFDEAHELSARNHSALLSVLDEYTYEKLFVLFLSTTMMSPSLSGGRGYFQAVFTEMPFDCSPQLKIQYSELTLERVNDPKFVSQFGRPYYYTWLQDYGPRDIDTGVGKLLRVLRSKLLASRDIDRYTPSKLGTLAIADVRLCLPYKTQDEGTMFELVRSHMRTTFSVSHHHGRICSGYPSEPLLAEAAAQQMNVWRTRRDITLLYKILEERLEDGLLDRGQRWQIVARALITEAYDRAVNIENPEPKNALIYNEGCSLIEFIRQLFPPEMADKVLDSTPVNVSEDQGRKLKNIFKKARIRFTHFSKSVEDHVFSQHAMAAAFIRGFAFICLNGGCDVDMILPVLMYGDGAIEPRSMTGILIKVGHLRKSDKVELDAEQDLGFFTAPGDEKLPYLAFVMDLGPGVQKYIPPDGKVPATKALDKLKRQLQKKRNVVSKTATRDDSQLQSSTKWNTTPRVSNKHGVMSLPHHTPLHLRYWIHTVGCTDKTFAVISLQDNQILADMLRIQESVTLYDHPHPKGLSYVQRQKYLFAARKQSYHWLNCDVLNPTTETLLQADADVDMYSDGEVQGED
ncbi:hypothetical protein C8Q75DRAFT_756344 [Abortiporus biennis]|nr:hypothetical protein C8Q75DRAFT_756344 [Abortiporus biennis]